MSNEQSCDLVTNLHPNPTDWNTKSESDGFRAASHPYLWWPFSTCSWVGWWPLWSSSSTCYTDTHNTISTF